ncbi:MAG: DNA polymerase III subunit delta [Erysipelotrichaceae bacterium]|nr:DNA polymerase III subunit delta [Erysipelotrichaceae bacterium]
MDERLKQQQPVVYQTLKNCLEHQRLSHALLFTGPKGTPKIEAALMLAQSLFCEHANPFGCGQCPACQRVLKQEYADLVILDGTKKSIKKEEILSLQERFSKTAVEKKGQKVYILHGAENATTEALNSLLKFLEEPQSQDITAILIVESTDRLLPTIVSRCQILPFRPVERTLCEKQAIKLGCTVTDAWLISHFVKDPEAVLALSETEAYQKAYAGFELFLEHIYDLSRCMIELQMDVFGSKSDAKEVLGYFIDCLTSFFEELACGLEDVPGKIKKKAEKLKEKELNLAQIQIVLLETKDKLSRPYNLTLVSDQMMIQLMEVIG